MSLTLAAPPLQDVMMPMVQKIAASGVNMKAVVAEHILPCAVAAATERGGFSFFIGHAMKMLEKYPGGMPRARVFAHAVKSIASPDQWKDWHPIVKANLSPSLYATIKAECDFEDI